MLGVLLVVPDGFLDRLVFLQLAVVGCCLSVNGGLCRLNLYDRQFLLFSCKRKINNFTTTAYLVILYDFS